MLQFTVYQVAALLWAAGLAQGICLTRILQTDPPSKLAQAFSFAGILVLIPVLEVLERFSGQVVR